jgi:nicotinate-nucleotide--dimethylbenzimidazole phosphoribosyltransferase
MSDPAFDHSVAAARALLDGLTKPPGSLGQLEDVAAQLAGISRSCPPPVPESPAVAVFAADHGVVASGVGIWPQEITRLMVETMARHQAAINAMARTVGASVVVVDVGVNADLSGLDGVRHCKVRRGTADLAMGPAMAVDDARAAIAVGRALATELVDNGRDCLVGGEMGIGNTTAASCLVGALTATPPSDLIGSGAGSTPESHATKTRIVTAAVDRVADIGDPIQVLAEVGGLEIAALAGFISAGVEAHVPVVIDGAIAIAALLVADATEPGLNRGCIAGHLSTEPSAAVGLRFLGMEPLIDLGLRLGEGTGACLAVTLLQAAARCITDMGRLEDLE